MKKMLFATIALLFTTNVSFALNKAELIEAIAKEAKLTKTQAEQIIELLECKPQANLAPRATGREKEGGDVFCKIDGIDEILDDKRIELAGIDPQKAKTAVIALQRILATDVQARITLKEGTRPNSISPNRAQEYWTPERMRNAKPMSLEVVDDDMDEDEARSKKGNVARFDTSYDAAEKDNHGTRPKNVSALPDHEENGIPEFSMEIPRNADAQAGRQSKTPGDYVDENGNRLSKRALNAFQTAHTSVNAEVIREVIAKGNKSEVAKRVLKDILENKIPCANCAGIEDLPEEEIQKIAKAEAQIQQEGWQLVVADGKPKVKRVQKKKLFFLFDVEIEEEAELGKQGIMQDDLKRPWWSLFAW